MCAIVVQVAPSSDTLLHIRVVLYARDTCFV